MVGVSLSTQLYEHKNSSSLQVTGGMLFVALRRLLRLTLSKNSPASLTFTGVILCRALQNAPRLQVPRSQNLHTQSAVMVISLKRGHEDDDEERRRVAQISEGRVFVCRRARGAIPVLEVDTTTTQQANLAPTACNVRILAC